MPAGKWKPKSEEQQRLEHQDKLERFAKIRNRPKYRYAEILDLVRTDTEHTGCEARIALFTERTRKQNGVMCRAHGDQMRKWLDKWFPMEIWQIHRRKVAETWGTYELVVVFLGEFADEAAMEKARAERRAFYERSFKPKTASAG